MQIIQKKIYELSRSELDQLKTLILRYYKSASDKFISDRLEKDYGYDIVMLKKEDIILGVNFYHLIKYKKEHWSRPSYVLHFGQVMKKSGYRGNIIWTLGKWYSRKNISPLFLLQNVTGIASFISPRAYENFILLFPKYHAELKTDCDRNVNNFLSDYFNRLRGMSIDYKDGFCFDSADLEVEDITDDWNKIHRAKNEEVNRLFINKGIIKMVNNRIYKMPRHITVCGVHRPFALKKRFNVPFNLLSNNEEQISQSTILKAS